MKSFIRAAGYFAEAIYRIFVLTIQNLIFIPGMIFWGTIYFEEDFGLPHFTFNEFLESNIFRTLFLVSFLLAGVLYGVRKIESHGNINALYWTQVINLFKVLRKYGFLVIANPYLKNHQDKEKRSLSYCKAAMELKNFNCSVISDEEIKYFVLREREKHGKKIGLKLEMIDFFDDVLPLARALSSEVEANMNHVGFDKRINQLSTIQFFISEAMHNHGSKHFYEQNKVKVEPVELLLEHEQMIGNFFSNIRTLAKRYSIGDALMDDSYDTLIAFIQKDFSDFCYLKADILDLSKIDGLIFDYANYIDFRENDSNLSSISILDASGEKSILVKRENPRC